MSEHQPSLFPVRYEAVVKINRDDPPERRARDIEEGISYACALLQDEYGYSAQRISDLLTYAEDNIWDEENLRRGD